MEKCILVVRGLSQYDVLIEASKKIAEGFRQNLDLPVYEVDITDNIQEFLNIFNSHKFDIQFIYIILRVNVNIKYS